MFKPRSIPLRELQEVRLGLDELEAVRLCDRDALHQEQAAQLMGVSRGTVQRLLAGARRKIATALVGSMALVIEEDTPHASLRSDRHC